jgi:TadE-like protein
MTHRRGRAGARDRGAVTAEFAVAMPALVLLLGFSLGAVDATLDKLRCVDAARDAALAQARGGDGASVGRAEAPSGAKTVVTVSGDLVRVTVTMRSRPLGRALPGVTVAGAAVATTEPSAAP